MPVPTLSLTESQALTALRTFLLSSVPPTVDVIRAENNRVPEPLANDFIVMTPLRQPRLGTNETSYHDNVFTASIAADTLIVTAVANGALAAGQLLTDGSWPFSIIANTTILSQVDGTPGGVGNYKISASQTVASETMYSGTRDDLVATEWTVQLDIHGPSSADNTRIIEALFRSDFGSEAIALYGFDLAPLYCGDPRQVPFTNGEQQYEYRWTMDAVMQLNPSVGTPMQFADELEAALIEVNA